jgi:hypothetical protein
MLLLLLLLLHEHLLALLQLRHEMLLVTGAWWLRLSGLSHGRHADLGRRTALELHLRRWLLMHVLRRSLRRRASLIASHVVRVHGVL